MKNIFFLVFLIAIMGGFVVLQIFLSKKESKWPGLILPIITVSVALLAAVGIILFSASTGVVSGGVIGGDGPIEQFETTTVQIADTSSIIILAVYTFLFMNIPTAILLIIYAAFRGKRKRQLSLEKMSAQDLE